MTAITQTNINNLTTRRNNILSELASISSTTAGGGPNVMGLPGQVDHDAYVKRLYEELARIEGLLDKYDAELNGGGEVLSEGIT